MNILRLGVFGGAFDPPHLAHRALAQTALAELGLDELRVIPTGQAWHKTRTLSDARCRLDMVRLTFADIPRLVIDEREIHRTGPSYTIDTLKELQAEHPLARLFLIMGKDQADVLKSWRDWEAIPGLATICVADRDLLTGDLSGFKPPAGMENRFLVLHMPLMNISATSIRSRSSQRQSIVPWVSPAVAQYIEDHHLYQTSS
ncbi:MAG: nicotinate (nicotinamide) nucleotide adenylyltransferase [Hylemonella sp.]